ncbi:MAG: DUF3793 family protein [Lachnospiraceae bacterium]|nr:DUF3793 family protein [Lachnospiraceae bacterium]
MSQEVFEIVQHMDLKNVENQLALQCAPLIAGLKPSNLLIISKSSLYQVRQILKNSGISYSVLLVTGQKITILLYNRKELEAYLAKSEVLTLFESMGYLRFSLEEILPVFQKRYQKYMEDNCHFPHEMGLLLGYPVEDVEGFIKNEGKNSLHIGYWKVYGNLAEKLQLFRKFELAKETLIQLVSNGVSMTDIIDIYKEDKLQKAAI